MNSDILKRLQASCMPAQRQLSAGVEAFGSKKANIAA